MIRPLEYEDFEAASRVLWLSFYQAEKKNHSMAGMERFRDLTSPVSLSVNSMDPALSFYGCFEGEALLAVGALKGEGHVLLLYVHPDHSGRGIGTKLLSFLEQCAAASRLTVNASDGAVSFYEKHGYHRIGERRVEEEMIFTPMEKRRK